MRRIQRGRNARVEPEYRRENEIENTREVTTG